MGEDVWFAHGIHFTEDELKRLAETGTGVAHCPISNMKLSSGVALVPKMLELGAVSYTHLDVYKRQFPDRAGPDYQELPEAG